MSVKKGDTAALAAVRARNMRAALKAGRWEAAQLELQALEQVAPGTVETRGLALELLVRRRALKEAARLALELLESFPSSPNIHRLAGEAASGLKDYERAERCFRESDHLHPSPFTQRWLGKTLTQLGRLDEAEATLAALDIDARLDLAWLYERRKEWARALDLVESFLVHHPEHAFACEVRLRLRAKISPAETLIEEVDTLEALGEDIPEGMMSAYFEQLIKSGQSTRARSFVASLGDVHDRTRIGLGWTAYRAQLHDLAFDLFCAGFASQRAKPIFLNALERSANRAGRTEDLVSLYESHAETYPKLYGRLKRLARCT